MLFPTSILFIYLFLQGYLVLNFMMSIKLMLFLEQFSLMSVKVSLNCLKTGLLCAGDKKQKNYDSIPYLLFADIIHLILSLPSWIEKKSLLAEGMWKKQPRNPAVVV